MRVHRVVLQFILILLICAAGAARRTPAPKETRTYQSFEWSHRTGCRAPSCRANSNEFSGAIGWADVKQKVAMGHAFRIGSGTKSYGLTVAQLG
jgi:hypothetical protein